MYLGGLCFCLRLNRDSMGMLVAVRLAPPAHSCHRSQAVCGPARFRLLHWRSPWQEGNVPRISPKKNLGGCARIPLARVGFGPLLYHYSDRFSRFGWHITYRPSGLMQSGVWTRVGEPGRWFRASRSNPRGPTRRSGWRSLFKRGADVKESGSFCPASGMLDGLDAMLLAIPRCVDYPIGTACRNILRWFKRRTPVLFEESSLTNGREFPRHEAFRS